MTKIKHSSLKVRVRSTGNFLNATINSFDKRDAVITLEQPETAVSPGQACVFYSKDDFGDKLLGGGWIHKSTNKNLST